MDNVLNDFLRLNSNESMRNLCLKVKESDFNIEGIVKLVEILSESGETLKFPNHNTADVPSTGGPSSLSTIICPLLLKEYFSVPKLGIVGRPAGGIDVLAQIDGYNLKLSKKEIYKIIDKTQYCHFISNHQYTPLDSKLFKFRNENGFKNIPGLVIASLLSKKRAVGVKNICLDIRYSHFGNFGKSLDEAKGLSDKFKQVSEAMKIKSLFYFSNNSKLFQPFIGRSESLLAIYEYLLGSKDNWLNNHIENDCNKMVKSLTKNKSQNVKLKEIILKNFEENIINQGGKANSFEKISKRTKSLHIHKLFANKTGNVKIDIMKMRDTIVKIQACYVKFNNEFPDPCGIIFFKNQGDAISKGETILSYRVLDKNLDYFRNELNNFVKIDCG